MAKRNLVKTLYVVSRSGAGRPCLQHRVAADSMVRTACGHDISMWSRAYRIDRIEVILCRQPGCRRED